MPLIKNLFKELKQRATKVPAIPPPNAQNLPSVVAQLKEALEIRLGRRGHEVDRAVTIRDLADSNMITIMPVVGSPLSSTPVDGGTGFVGGWVDLEIPPKPLNLEAVGAFNLIAVKWTPSTQGGHSFTEVYRSETDDFTTKKLIGTSQTRFYADQVATGSTYFYWIRFVSNANFFGPYNDITGTEGNTSQDPQAVADILAGLISNNELAQHLRTPISLIPSISDAANAANSTASAASSAASAAVASAQAAAQSADEARAIADQAIIDAEAALDEAKDAAVVALEALNGNDSHTISVGSALVQNEQTAEALLEALVTQDAEIRNLDFSGVSLSLAIAKLDTKVEENYALATQTDLLFTAVNENNALVSEISTSVSDLDSATGESIRVLSAQAGANAAAITNQIKAFTDSQTAYTEATQLLKNAVGQNTADITNQIKAFSDAQSAYAQATVTLNAQTSANTASITKFAKAVVDNDSATTESLRQLSATVGENKAQIISQVRAYADSGIASAEAVEILTVKVGANEGSILTHTGAIATLEDVQLSFSAVFDNNGYVSGYGFYNNGPSDSGFIINADNFYILDPSGDIATEPVFAIAKLEGVNTMLLNAKAYIPDASITNLMVKELAADKILAGIIQVAIELQAAKITGGELDIGNGKFHVEPNGTTTISSGVEGSRQVITNDTIKIYDTGTLRVHIGNLSA